MKLFVDSANLEVIRSALDRGFVGGVTTNPSILAKEEAIGFVDIVQGIVDLLVEANQSVPLSVEVFAETPEEMVRQAREFITLFDYPGLNIKVPIGWDELAVVSELSRSGVAVNCTCCMTSGQAVMAALAGAEFVSLFYGRIRDAGGNAAGVVSETRELFKRHGVATELIVGSIRNARDVTDALLAGAHIVTVPPRFLPQMAHHPKSEEAVQQFLSDYARWINQSVRTR